MTRHVIGRTGGCSDSHTTRDAAALYPVSPVVPLSSPPWTMSSASDSDTWSTNSVNRRSTFSLPPSQTTSTWSSTATPLLSLSDGRSRSSERHPDWRRTTDVSSMMSQRFASPVREADWKRQRQDHEVRKLQREVDQCNQKVSSLSSQLATKSHVVTAFEQLLESVRMQMNQLEAASEQKDAEIERLRSKFRNELEDFKNPCADEESKSSAVPNRRNTMSESKSSLTSSLKSSISMSKTSLPETSCGQNGFQFRTTSIGSFSDLSIMDMELSKQLEKELQEKEKALTDLRLESLTTADQLQSIDELLSQLTAELADLRVNAFRSC